MQKNTTRRKNTKDNKETQKYKKTNIHKHRKNAHHASGQRAAATARRAQARRARIMIMSEQRLIFVSGAYREKVDKDTTICAKKGSILYKKRPIHQTLLKDIDKLAVGHSGQT